MKVMVTGSRGMLGTELMEELASWNPAGFDLPQLDISDPVQCRTRIEEIRPEVLIHAAALTDVDYCESHPEEALQVNGYATGYLATAAASVGARMVYFSSDYVFDGTRRDGYVEEDTPNPLSAYGRSKLEGENRIRSVCPNHIIIRTSWLFGCHGKNFIRTIIGIAREGQPLRVVHDQRGSPTFARDLAVRTRLMIEAGCRGDYHVTNSGACTWYELALRSIEAATVAGCRILPVTTGEFPRPAPRPAYSVLLNRRSEREGFAAMRPWQEAVREYVTSCLSAP